ncbi:MAG: transcriptional regulator TrmB [Parcubacteria group bacterium]|nr:transcriptional regulator TrmB [Parcubacteria group bacterium]
MTDIKSEKQKMTYIQSALKAGLSAKAASVYVGLLEAGSAISPKAIILRTGLHRQYVYDALKELQERGLVSTTGKDRSIKYQASNPDKLVQEVEKKRIDTLDGVQSLMQLYDTSPAGVVEVIRGARAVIEGEFKMLEEAKDGDFLDIIGGAGMHWVELFDGRVAEWEALRKEKNVKLRYIGSGEDVQHNKEKSPIENESRAIPGIADVVNVSIRPDSVSFNFYVPEVMSVRVKNTAAVESQRALFEVLWKAAS